MTLAEFLLVRIAEDEVALAHVTLVVDEGGPFVNFRSRVLAECEAKRRIVEWHGERDDCCEEVYGDFQFDAEPGLSAGTDAMGQLTVRQSIGYQPFVGCKTLMMLALPYADHEDYDEAWCPYCITDALMHFATLGLVLPEAVEAAENLLPARRALTSATGTAH